MGWLVFKYLTTSGLVVFVSEIAKHSDRLGAFITPLPLITVSLFLLCAVVVGWFGIELM